MIDGEGRCIGIVSQADLALQEKPEKVSKTVAEISRPQAVAAEHMAHAGGGGCMANCEVCGNEYDKAFVVEAAGARHTFDSFECAIQAMAPICEHCQCRVIGHGAEVGGRFFCCAHCARTATSADVKDRAA
jgi:hypothetical protein